ncbi:MAG: DUF2794 domain-containing protein [Methylocella sp.]
MTDLESAEDRRHRFMTDRVRLFASRAPAIRAPAPQEAIVSFDRLELREILNLYGRKVAAGEWRDYALDFTPQKAVFSIYRRASECPLYEIEKNPRQARKQGLYAVIAASGVVLKRGAELRRVIAVLDKRLRLVSE